MNHNDMLTLRPSPRLWVDPQARVDLRSRLHSPFLKDLADELVADAEWLLTEAPIAEREASSYKMGASYMASHMRALTAAWVLTGDARYRKGAIDRLASMMNWRHISCEARNNTPDDAEFFFCLTYGRHAATVALMYDLFKPNITPDEEQVFFDVLDRFYLTEALKSLERPPWWVGKQSNWNGVCAGGMGMLALAFYDSRPECRKLLPFVEESLAAYLDAFVQNGGGYHEGTGYWNFGLTHAASYLLSWERATGRSHPAFDLPELRKTLYFPLDFDRLTFGDNDGWAPKGFYFKLATRFGQEDAALKAADRLIGNASHREDPKEDASAGSRGRLSGTYGDDLLYACDDIPREDAIAQFRQKHAATKQPVARLYSGLDWAVLADDSAFPTMRLSARGGSSALGSHGMLDLLSFKCMFDGQVMITDQGGKSPVAFTRRGRDLFDRRADSKSTLFVDGLGCKEDSRCTVTELIRQDDILGVRIDGSEVYLNRCKDLFIGRLYLMVENRYWLVLDSLYDPDRAARHWIESRFHTFAEPAFAEKQVTLALGDTHMTLSFSGLEGGVLQRAYGLPTLPVKQSNIIRWMSKEGRPTQFHVTALNPGDDALVLRVEEYEARTYAINIQGANGYLRTIRMSDELHIRH